MQKSWHDMPMSKTHRRRRLADTYSFDGFRAQSSVQGIFGDPQARVVSLTRRRKKRSAANAGRRNLVGTTALGDGYGICRAGSTAFILSLRCGGLTAASVVR